MKLVIWLVYTMCGVYIVRGYNILAVFPVPSRSHNTLGKGIVNALLDAGHQVRAQTQITSHGFHDLLTARPCHSWYLWDPFFPCVTSHILLYNIFFYSNGQQSRAAKWHHKCDYANYDISTTPKVIPSLAGYVGNVLPAKENRRWITSNQFKRNLAFHRR